MDQKKVIKNSNLPQKLPVSLTLSIIIALNYWKAPQWLFGAVITILVLYWIVVLSIIYTQKDVDIFKTEKDVNR